MKDQGHKKTPASKDTKYYSPRAFLFTCSGCATLGPVFSEVCFDPTVPLAESVARLWLDGFS